MQSAAQRDKSASQVPVRKKREGERKLSEKFSKLTKASSYRVVGRTQPGTSKQNTPECRMAPRTFPTPEAFIHH